MTEPSPACGTASTPTPDVDLPEWEVSPRVVAERLAAGEAMLLVDCRKAVEREIAKIEGDVWIPLDDLAVHLDRIHAFEEGPIVVYCHAGRRSLMLAMLLRDQGLEDVRSMAGGIRRWSSEIDPTVPTS